MKKAAIFQYLSVDDNANKPDNESILDLMNMGTQVSFGYFRRLKEEWLDIHRDVTSKEEPAGKEVCFLRPETEAKLQQVLELLINKYSKQ